MFAAVPAAIALLMIAGCSTTGMNDPDSFAIYFNNDLRQSVVVALCHSDHSAKCEHAYYRDAIAPGTAEPENISPDIRTEWAIETPDGQLLRCVVLYWHYWPGHDEDVRVSAAPRWTWPCSRTTPATPH
jgi:hypothetical protein